MARSRSVFLYCMAAALHNPALSSPPPPRYQDGTAMQICARSHERLVEFRGPGLSTAYSSSSTPAPGPLGYSDERCVSDRNLNQDIGESILPAIHTTAGWMWRKPIRRIHVFVYKTPFSAFHHLLYGNKVRNISIHTTAASNSGLCGECRKKTILDYCKVSKCACTKKNPRYEK